MKTLVIVATYNERDNVGPLAREVLASPIGADLLIIDDNSPDGTGQAADVLAAESERVHVIHRPGKLGLGSASLDGLRHAKDCGYDLAIIMDADFSHHPRYLPDLVAKAAGYDLVIGSRYAPGGGVANWPLRRKLMSWAINTYARWLLGLKVRDCSGAFRCYRLAKMGPEVLDAMISKGYSYLEELLYRCRLAGMTMTETPIVFEDRRAGASKISHREAVVALWVMFRLFLGRIAGVFHPKNGETGDDT